MDITPRIDLTPEARFFLAPDHPLQRQYEAFRAYFVEGLPSLEVARRFGYAPGSFRVLCHQFRQLADKPGRFFQAVTPGPRFAPARDAVRELVVTLRSCNLSVYDIQRELAQGGHTISINALAVLLREEGFTRLPRRLDEERPPALRPEAQAVADVRALSLEPRSFRTRLGGLFLFVPLMKEIRLAEVLAQANLPGTTMIPATQALRTLLALKLVGKERKSHVMDLVCDPGLALFAGLNAVPSCSYLASYSSRVDRRACVRLMAAWFDEVRRAGLPRGDSIDLDFHAVPANTQEEPLEKHYLPAAAAVNKASWCSWPATPQPASCATPTPGSPRIRRPRRCSASPTSGRSRTGQPPAELVFDSQLTTYEQLHQLNQPRHQLPDAAPPDAADAGADLEPARVGLAAHHLAGG